MENTNKDIEQFDSLEPGQVPSGDLKDIQDLDQWIKSLPLKEVGVNFTSTVIASALLAKKRHANFKILLWMMGFFALMIIVSFALIGSGEANIEVQYLEQIKEQTFRWMAIMTDPRLRQLFLVVEGIICLVVIDKIASSFRLLRHSV